MVIFVERQANLMKSTNCICFILHAFCNTDTFYLTPGFLHLYNTANGLISGGLCSRKAGRRRVSHPHVSHRTDFDSPVITIWTFFGRLPGVCSFVEHPSFYNYIFGKWSTVLLSSNGQVCCWPSSEMIRRKGKYSSVHSIAST